MNTLATLRHWFRRSPVATGGSGLERGQLYRVRAAVDPKYTSDLSDRFTQQEAQTKLQAAISSDLTSSGFDFALSAIQDPSDLAIWTLLARWAGPQNAEAPRETKPEMAILSWEPVAEPDDDYVTPSRDSWLDRGLSRAEVEACRFALSADDDPKRLDGFAATLDGDFPILASILHAKATLETLARASNSVAGRLPHPDLARETARLRTLGVHVLGPGLASSSRVGASGDVASEVLDPLRDVTSGFSSLSIWDRYEPVVRALDGWTHQTEDAASVPLSDLERDLVAAGLSAYDVKLHLPDALAAIQINPRLLLLTPSTLALDLDVPEPIAAVALASFRRNLGNGIVLVDRNVTRKFLPPMTASNAALLAESSRFAPERAGVADPRALERQYATWSDPRAEKALQQSIARARRTLDRQNWVQWYRKLAEQELLG